MIGVIGPLVQGKRELRGTGGPVAVFAVGAVVGATITGAVVGVLAAGFQALAGEGVRPVVVGVAGCLLLLVDLGLRTPTLRRQTCSTWYRERGPRFAWPLWGFDLGLGFSTIRLSSLYWLMVLFVAAFVSPAFAPLALAFYGLGLGAVVAAAVVAQAWSTPSATASPGLGLLVAAGRVRLASIALLGVVSLAILAAQAPW
jgi:hypothetical protein